ncbi:MAG: hypothetical protein Q8936_14895 [Bacillota bacterium]|nr:hypothetical protein [Bacillota bacterium]
MDGIIKTLNSNKEEVLLFVKKAKKLFLELAIKEDVRVDTINLFW